MYSDKQNVVVLGGGAAGFDIVRKLSAKLDPTRHNLILVNNRTFHVWLPALVRAIVSHHGHLEDLDNGALIPYDKLFIKGNGTLKVGNVVGVVPADKDQGGGSILLEGGESIPFAVLVLTPGSIWEGPVSLPATKDDVDLHFLRWRAKFRDAKHVVLAGGGTVGIEIAGEIKDIYPEKPVTIVQGSDALLNPTYPSNFRDQMFKEISSRGVNVLFNEVLDNVPTDGRTLEGIKTRSGKFIDADLVIPTRGGRPNTAFLADSGIPLSVSGHIRTEPTLQVKGFPDIFAAGDVLDWAEQKQCAKYPAHAEVVAANVLERLKDHQPSVHYKGSHEIALIVNGRNGGGCYFENYWGFTWTFGAWFCRLIKSKDLFVPWHRGRLGY